MKEDCSRSTDHLTELDTVSKCGPEMYMEPRCRFDRFVLESPDKIRFGHVDIGTSGRNTDRTHSPNYCHERKGSCVSAYISSSDLASE